MTKESKNDPRFLNQKDPSEPKSFEAQSLETIDLTAMYTDGMSESGSFDVTDIQLTSFGKLLNAIPIPALLVDESGKIIFSNNACRKIDAPHEKMRGKPFSGIFVEAQQGSKGEKLVEQVFTNRIPMVTEAVLGTQKARIWARMHLRSLRIHKKRSVLAIIEDITLEKKQLGVDL